MAKCGKDVGWAKRSVPNIAAVRWARFALPNLLCNRYV